MRDRKFAAMAAQMEAKARSDIGQTKEEETSTEVEEKAKNQEVDRKQVSEFIYDETLNSVNTQRAIIMTLSCFLCLCAAQGIY